MSRIIVKTLSLEETTDLMRQAGIRTSAEKVRQGILQGVYPWGECIQMKAPSCTVYQKMFFRWLKERGEEVPEHDAETPTP